MNYFALAGGIVAALLGLNAILSFVRVAFGKARWHDTTWGPIVNVLWAAAALTLSVWLFSVAL